VATSSTCPSGFPGRLEAWRLPAFPPGHPARDNNVQRLAFAGRFAESDQAQLRLPHAA
jgi:hypothetical protein